jgi:hypothetical protein
MVHWQVRLTGRLQQLLPSFLPAIFGLGSHSAVDMVVVDNERHILYVLCHPGTIQVCGMVDFFMAGRLTINWLDLTSTSCVTQGPFRCVGKVNYLTFLDFQTVAIYWLNTIITGEL